MITSTSTSDESSPAWRVVSASVCGASHIARGEAGQDAHGWVILPDRTLVAAVADGAGTAELGGVGAHLAVNCALQSVRKAAPTAWPEDASDWRDFLSPILHEVQDELMKEASTCDRLPR